MKDKHMRVKWWTTFYSVVSRGPESLLLLQQMTLCETCAKKKK